MRFIGDQYVKEEFRLHKAADPTQARIFTDEWMQYCVQLSKQLSQQGIVRGFIGRNLTEENLESFANEQLHQLLELKTEAEKPK
uniref:Succinate dehydrogenase assembly factor 3 n=1 Tax=Plectus sambesii TaxID=2011161 RepID=A0A914UYJ2_9BILA